MEPASPRVKVTSRRMSLPAFLWARRHPLRMFTEISKWDGDLAEVRIGRQSFVLLKSPGS